MSESVANYVNQVVPNTYQLWRKVGAHTAAYGYPEQSLFWHTVGASLFGISILDYIEAQGYGRIVNKEEAALCATLHDMDRESGKESKTITVEELAAKRTELNLNDYAPTLSNEDLLWIVRNTHLFRRNANFAERFGDSRMSALLYLTALTDGLAVIGNPREAFSPRGNKQDRALAPLLKKFASEQFELGYHQLNTVTGFVSNLIHSAFTELLRQALPESEQEAFQPLCFFPNGTIYIAKTGAIEKGLEAIGLEQLLSKLTDVFYQKFKNILEKTEQFEKSEKGQPTPAPFAFLMDSPSLIKAAFRRRQIRWRSSQARRQRLSRIDEEIRVLAERLRNDTVAQSDQRKLEGERKKLEGEYKRISEREQNFIQKMKEGDADSGKEGQLATLLMQQDFTTRYGDLPESFDWVELKLVSDYFAFVIRLAGKFGLAEQTLGQLADAVGIAKNEVSELTLKKGGLNYQAILLAYHLLRTSPARVKEDVSDDFLATIEAAQATQVTAIERLETLSNELAEFFSKNVKRPHQKRAMVDAGLLTKKEAASIGDDTPLEQIFLDELASIFAEHLEMNQRAFPAKATETSTLCNFCGRHCKGITLSAKITPGDGPKIYSGYNMAKDIGKKPRQVCALCFFENVLRTVLFPNKGKGLSLFVFPEYSFSRHHAHIFRKLVRDVFPKALTDDETIVQEGDPDGLIAAIQHTLNAQPEAADAEAILPVYVAPLAGDTSLSQWLSHAKNLLWLWDALGLKYILTSDFYPEVEGIGGVKGVVELRGCHPQLATRLRRWIQAIRKQSIQGLPETALTISEALTVRKLMEAVDDLADGKHAEDKFYTASGSFMGAVLYGKQKSKKKKGA